MVRKECYGDKADVKFTANQVDTYMSDVCEAYGVLYKEETDINKKVFTLWYFLLFGVFTFWAWLCWSRQPNFSFQPEELYMSNIRKIYQVHCWSVVEKTKDI